MAARFLDRKPGTLIVAAAGNESERPYFVEAVGNPAALIPSDDLRLDRPDPRPISFGHGIHHCLGAALARLQARIALPAFVSAFPEYRVAEADLRWTRSMTFRGPETLPLILQPARRPLPALAS